MLPRDAFSDQPTLTGSSVRLEPLTEAVAEDYLLALADAEVTRLTGSHEHHDRETVLDWLATRRDRPDRADWAIHRIADGAFLGEAVLNDFDPHNASANYRVFLAGPEIFGLGYGTETTRLVRDYALDVVGLHRLSLTVFTFNERARRTYLRCGFSPEGRLRHVLRWDGRWHDELVMSILATDPRP